MTIRRVTHAKGIDMRDELVKVHPSAERLLESARRCTMHLPSSRQLHTWLQVRTVLRITAARLTNWKQRGVSEAGALQAEAKWGCSAYWILTGIEPPGWSSGARAQVLDRMADSLSWMQQALTAVPEDLREELGEALHAWAKRGGRDAYRRTVEALLMECDVTIVGTSHTQ